MKLVKYDLAIVTMEISVSTYSEMVREEAVCHPCTHLTQTYFWHCASGKHWTQSL